MIVETGEGLENSNSYVLVSDARAYAADRGIEAIIDADDTDLDRALVRATDYADASYIFRSVRAHDAQALECPRYGETTISLRLKNAVIELAAIALTRDLFALPEGRGVASEEITAGRVSTKTTYDPLGDPRADPYPHVSRILSPIASRRGQGVQVGMMTR